MGNTVSGEEGRHRLGFHVLKVKDGSPAQKAGIKPYFEYIMAVNGIRLNQDSSILQEQMLANEGKPMMLDIYSTREQAARRVEMTPSRDWGTSNDGLIGCSIRFCMFDTANDVIWHILDVYQGSPAELAGLCPHSDYIIGTPYGIMRSESDLYDLVEDNVGKPLRLYTYNLDADQCREIVIVPNDEWGGVGLLGCDVGYGYLHRIPKQSAVDEAHQAALAAGSGTGITGGAGPSTSSYSRQMTSASYSAAPEMSVKTDYYRNAPPTSYQSGNGGGGGGMDHRNNMDIIAPTPQSPQSPTWLNSEQQFENGIHENGSQQSSDHYHHDHSDPHHQHQHQHPQHHQHHYQHQDPHHPHQHSDEGGSDSNPEPTAAIENVRPSLMLDEDGNELPLFSFGEGEQPDSEDDFVGEMLPFNASQQSTHSNSQPQGFVSQQQQQQHPLPQQHQQQHQQYLQQSPQQHQQQYHQQPQYQQQQLYSSQYQHQQQQQQQQYQNHNH